MGKNRVPLQADEEFLIRLKTLQRKIRTISGEDRSLRALTKDLAKTKAFEEVEKKILNGEFGIDINIKLDGRGL